MSTHLPLPKELKGTGTYNMICSHGEAGRRLGWYSILRGMQAQAHHNIAGPLGHQLPGKSWKMAIPDGADKHDVPEQASPGEATA